MTERVRRICSCSVVLCKMLPCSITCVFQVPCQAPGFSRMRLLPVFYFNDKFLPAFAVRSRGAEMRSFANVEPETARIIFSKNLC